MKKKWFFKEHSYLFSYCRKIVKIMRLSIFLIILTSFQSIALNNFAQGQRFNIEVKNQTLSNVLMLIEKESGYFLFYNNKVINLDEVVSINLKNTTISEVLNELFKETDITYDIIKNKQVVFSKKSGESQQKISISGRVTDSSGSPLPGVTVVVKGTTNGTVTNTDGEYSITNVPGNATLQFSFVGMKTQEFPVAGKTVIDIKMEEESIGIEEVIAVGYGTMKKSDLTGSVVRVDLARKEMSSNVSLTQALQGYVPGVNASSGTGAGSSGSLSIRGQTSLSASDYPLIVVDGTIFYGSISDLNINDIESIDVLKDASAAAVYGARSANGVLIITTKHGTSEKPLFNFNVSYGYQDISTTKRTKIMNGEQYAIRLVDYDYYLEDLITWYDTSPTDASGRPERIDITDKELVAGYLRSTEEQENYLAGNEVDWLDKVIRTAPIQNYNFSVSGKTNRTNYYLSTSYTDQKGITLNDNYNRFTLRANFKNQITDWLTVGLNTTYSHQDESGKSASIWYALRASPWANVTDENGDYPILLTGESMMLHPIGNYLSVDDVDISDKVNILFSAKIDVPKIKGLTYEVNYTKFLSFAKENEFYPVTTYGGQSYNGLATKSHSEGRYWSVDNILTYTREFGKHKINATLLYSRENKTGETSSLQAYDFDIDELGYNSIGLGTTQSVSSSAWEENSLAYMARLNYVYNKRYLLTATIRRDGYSGFGADNKFAIFPSASVGWVASEESFLKSTEWLNFLKLRLSYGLNGNQGIGRYASLAKLGSTNYAFDGSTAVGLYSSGLGNADLGWESTASINLGLDYTVLNQRISGQVDVYKAKTSDVIVGRSLPSTTGYSSITTNLGGVKNKGIEISLTTRNIDSKEFKWESRFMFSLNRNKLTELYEGVTEDIGNSWFVGEPINSIYDYKIIGMWQEEDLFNGDIYSGGYYPGMYKLKDYDDSGTITADGDRDVIGYSDPNYRFGINNTFSYKNFTLSFFFNSIQGGNGYYMVDNQYAFAGYYFSNKLNQPAVHQYWTPDTPVNNAPAISYSPPVSHGIYEDRSFIRLQDVTLSYDVKRRTLERYGLDNLQFYLSGKNLYTWTKYSGWDPETGDGSPMMRNITAGVKLSF